MKLYTRTGDDGTTGLFGGDRVAKDHPRVEAYGSVDELNASIGLASAALEPVMVELGGLGSMLASILAALQSRLFDIGADLATPAGSKHESKVRRFGDELVIEAERWIDQVDEGNAPMRHFVMPGGTELAARLHLARTICRRAERRMIQLAHDEPVNPTAIVFINRVSDLLFAMARRVNQCLGVPDVPWIPPAAV